MAVNFGPVASRFIRDSEGYVAPASLARWERSAIESLPQMRPPVGPGGSISGSGQGWDDCDE